MKLFFPTLATIGALVMAASNAFAQHVISTSPGLFTPSFRDASNSDGGNTTFFGWSPGSFDAPTDNEIIDNPPALQGVGGLTGTLNQIGTDDILSGSNNIYTAGFTLETLTLGIPTNGIIGMGFTTVIIQGHTIFGGYASDDAFTFPILAGATAQFVIGVNASGQGQFWAKYQITGNAASYSLDFDLVNGNVSISELQVDTKWSATGFASDSAQAVPEASTTVMFVSGLAALVIATCWRRRNFHRLG